jgi:hypothetical protein
MFTFETRPKFNIMGEKVNKFCFPRLSFLRFLRFIGKRRYRIPSYLFVNFVNHRKTLVMFRNASNVKVSKMYLC